MLSGRRRQAMAKVAFERSSGNVFADLGMPEAEEHKLKAGLVSKLACIMAEVGLTQTAAAQLTGISQPDLSRVLRGRFRDFSAARLIKAITSLHSEVEITVRHEGQEIGERILIHA
ncbi:MAG: XRE family transcriptional regulator [Alphaproteobacteria bacterium]|nr:MAG: XRE family transcriptional regulator [Alphaproteobacteria bacterium]